MTYIFLGLSLTLNLILFVYVRWLIKTLAKAELKFSDIWQMILEYKTHLKSVHELELFYGDETLASLMNHSTQVIENLEEFDLILAEPDVAEIQEPGDEIQ